MTHTKDSIDERDELAVRWECEDLDRLFDKWDHEPKKAKAKLAWVGDVLRGEH